ncbi:RICIN domain-containing protein [Kribbella ginsengisoli]|uniref:Ricin B lectin domain-containing protein n=1 Tax=Kribbella ginsengisoli TaxID=363865 RepID=A0ABP6VTJ8_9ACTN
MRARILLSTAVLTVVCLVSGVNTAAAAFYYGPFRFISTAQPQRCVTVPAGSTTPGQRLILWDCTGGRDQYWTLWGGEGPAWHIRNHNSGQCLAVEEVRNNGSWLVQRQCSQSLDQFWDVAGLVAAFRNYQSGQYMSLGSGSGNGSPASASRRVGLVRLGGFGWWRR